MAVLIIYLFVSGCAGSSLLGGLVSSCCEWGYSPVAGCGLLTAVASLIGEPQ